MRSEAVARGGGYCRATGLVPDPLERKTLKKLHPILMRRRTVSAKARVHMTDLRGTRPQPKPVEEYGYSHCQRCERPTENIQCIFVGYWVCSVCKRLHEGLEHKHAAMAAFITEKGMARKAKRGRSGKELKGVLAGEKRRWTEEDRAYFKSRAIRIREERTKHVERLAGKAERPQDTPIRVDLRQCDRCGAQVLDIEHLEDFRFCFPCHSHFVRLDKETMRELLDDLWAKKSGAVSAAPPRPSLLEIWTDGGCEPNPGVGGWAAIILRGGALEKELSGGERDTTNNRMELAAAIAALEFCEPGMEVVVYSDSQYVVNGITKWVPGWKQLGWQRKTKSMGQSVAPLNVDLWKRLDALNALRLVRWEWVRGHAGSQWNERADQLAAQARLEIDL